MFEFSVLPVTKAWCILRLQMEEWPPDKRVGVSVLNKQLQTAYKGYFCSLGVV
jgi:hypothetical protein